MAKSPEDWGIKNCTFENCGIAVRADIPGQTLNVQGSKFHGNRIDLDIRRARKAELKGNVFSQNVIEQPPEMAERATRKFFGGFSFTKGDHLK